MMRTWRIFLTGCGSTGQLGSQSHTTLIAIFAVDCLWLLGAILQGGRICFLKLPLLKVRMLWKWRRGWTWKKENVGLLFCTMKCWLRKHFLLHNVNTFRNVQCTGLCVTVTEFSFNNQLMMDPSFYVWNGTMICTLSNAVLLIVWEGIWVLCYLTYLSALI